MRNAASRIVTSLLVAVLAAGCATVSLNEAPIVDRSVRRDAPASPAVGTAPVTREAQDGNYVVQRGDTLYSIALAFGQDYRDLARWNGLDDPSRLQVGQTLRVQPPADQAGSGVVAAVPVAPVPAAEVRPLDGAKPLPPVPSAPASPGVPPSPAPGSGPATIAPPAVTPAPAPLPAPIPAPASPTSRPDAKPESAAEPTLAWSWPATGKVIEPFDDPRNKGIDIAGKEGDPVLAANDGQVVYSGNGLRGYGNLVIIKHTDDFISAYAHNRQILVKQGQTVKRGQRIAEIGRTDADVPKLHFEVRRQGKPVDPMKYLPAR
jgi:lipoprotein NlpD